MFRRDTIPHKVMKSREKKAKKLAASKSGINMRKVLRQLNINIFFNETALLVVQRVESLP